MTALALVRPEPDFITAAGTPCRLGICAGMNRLYAVAVYELDEEGFSVPGATFERLIETSDFREAMAIERQIRRRLPASLNIMEKRS